MTGFSVENLHRAELHRCRGDMRPLSDAAGQPSHLSFAASSDNGRTRPWKISKTNAEARCQAR